MQLLTKPKANKTSSTHIMIKSWSDKNLEPSLVFECAHLIFNTLDFSVQL